MYGKRFSAIALAICAISVWCAPVALGGDGPQMPMTVYVFNGTGDGFDYNAQALIWQRLGLLNDDGSPGTIQDNGNITNSDGDVVGMTITDGDGNIIGYRNADGTAEGYDISADSDDATLDNAWQRVADNGTIEIIKHGASYAEDDGMGGTVERDGGGQQVDDGKVYDGYKSGATGAGTGVGYACPAPPGEQPDAAGAYCLTPRPGAGITFNANGCHTSNDPDPGNDDIGPVTDSAEGVEGVGAATGNDGVIIAGVAYTLKGTAKQKQAAQNALEAEAGRTGHRNDDDTVDAENVADYISDLPFNTRWQTLKDLLGPTGASINLTYSKMPKGDGAGGNSTCPIQVTPSPGFTEYLQDVDPTVLNTALIIPPFAVIEPELFHIVQLSQIPPLPPDLFLGSGCFDYRLLQIEPGPFNGPLIYMLETDLDPTLCQPHFFDEFAEQWIPIPPQNIDGQQVIFQSENVGIFALLTPEGPITCPGDINGDTFVNVFDLLDMLAAWGDCPQPCPPSCAADLNGDCIVNVFDLLDLLSAWGPCDG